MVALLRKLAPLLFSRPPPFIRTNKLQNARLVCRPLPDEGVRRSSFATFIRWSTAIRPVRRVLPLRIGRTISGWLRADRRCAPSVLKLIGREDLIGDERYATPDARLQREAEVDAIVTDWTKERTKQEAMAQLSAVGVPAGAVLDTQGQRVSLLYQKGRESHIFAGSRPRDRRFETRPRTATSKSRRSPPRSRRSACSGRT